MFVGLWFTRVNLSYRRAGYRLLHFLSATSAIAPIPVLNNSFTHPAHRRHGAGKLLMEWGIRKADELGLETYIEASPLGSTLYRKHGFRIVGEADVQPDASMEEDDEEWRRCRERMSPLRFAIMKRPVGGRWEEGTEEWRMVGDFESNIWASAD